MSRLAGVMSIPNSFTPGQVISSAQVNSNFADIASEITNSLPRDGSAAMSAGLPLGANYIEGTAMTAPSTPSAGKARLYFKTASSVAALHLKTSDGRERSLMPAISVRHYGAVGDGATDDASAINAALAAAASAGISTVLLPSGTYRVASPVIMQAGVTLLGEGPSSIIKQANGAGLKQVVDFTDHFGGVVATGAKLRDLVVDANRDNNTGIFVSGDFRRAVYYGNTNHVVVDNCTIQNANGYGIHGASCVGLLVTRNRITNCELHRIFLVHTSGGFDADVVVRDNYLDGAILIGGVNGVTVLGNQFVGHLIGHSADPMTVDISGTTVTWASGPKFDNAKSGMLLIAKNGTIQGNIRSVESNTSLTTVDDFGTETGVAAMIGDDDLLSVAGCKRFVVANNNVRNGASFGISLSGLFDEIEDGVVANNVMYFQGKQGFGLLGDGGGLGGTGGNNIAIIGNHVIDAVQGDDAGVTSGAGERHSYVIKGSTLENILVEGNLAIDRAGLTHSWLNVTDLAAGSIAVGPGNQQRGAQNDGIAGGISSITLESGWGSTAAVSDIVSHGHGCEFTVTANGSGIGANPAVTVNTVAHKPGQEKPLYQAKMVGGTGTLSHLFDENFSTRSAIVFRYGGTPVAGATYKILIQ